MAIFIPWVPETPQLVRGGRGGEGALAFFAQLGFAQRREPCEGERERERERERGGIEEEEERLIILDSLSRPLSEPSPPGLGIERWRQKFSPRDFFGNDLSGESTGGGGGSGKLASQVKVGRDGEGEQKKGEGGGGELSRRRGRKIALLRRKIEKRRRGGELGGSKREENS